MQLIYRCFYTHKFGNGPKEYEDAFADDKKSGYFSIADGAAEADFAKEWAQKLTQGFVAVPSCLSRPKKGRSREQIITKWLEPLQIAWYNSIDWQSLPWYTRLKHQQQGGTYSYATFLGLELQDAQVPHSKRKWRAIATGDCVMFQVREEKLITSFPLRHSSQFDNTPTFIYSNPTKNEDSLRFIQKNSGSYLFGDTFFLCSDALAKWCFTQIETAKNPWTKLANLGSQQEFEEMIDGFRYEKAIRNDDTTVMMIRID
jgi:hypothetical protein